MNMGLPKWFNIVLVLGAAGTVTVAEKLNPKMKDKRLTCIFVGCVDDHGGD